MAKRRIPFLGLLAVLLALIAQLGAGASVPRPDLLGYVAAADIICHGPDNGDDAPSTPMHPLDCLVCPLCVALHTPLANLLPKAMIIRPSGLVTVVRCELPPPSTAPPSPHRPPAQPRAPPAYS